MTTIPPAAIGVDVKGRKLDVALVRGSRVVYAAEHQLGRDTAAQIGVISEALEQLLALADHPTTIWMEKLWLRTDKGVAAAEMVHRTATRVETLALAGGFRVGWVATNTWRKDILGNGALRTAQGKEAAIEYVERVYGYKAPSHDAADAVCVAAWGVWQARVAGRIPA